MPVRAGAGVDVLHEVPDDAMMYLMGSYHCYERMQVQVVDVINKCAC